ncbi:hypothetical protein D3C71_1141670 [compost metagenome]
MGVKIFMDDLRPAYKGWLLARTTSECLELLEKHRDNIDVLSLDHDMTEKDNDGYWLVKEMVERLLYAEKVQFHTANNQGRENMYHYLRNAILHEAVPEMELQFQEAKYDVTKSEGAWVPWD